MRINARAHARTWVYWTGLQVKTDVATHMHTRWCTGLDCESKLTHKTHMHVHEYVEQHSTRSYAASTEQKQEAKLFDLISS